MGNDNNRRRATARAPIPRLHELDDGLQHLAWRVDIVAMHAQLTAREAHHHSAIARQTKARHPRQPERRQPPEELALYRSKHLFRAGRKFRCSSDQIRVVTSTCFSVMRMLFTEEGRPPRWRFEMVPAVEMIVALRVCSM